MKCAKQQRDSILQLCRMCTQNNRRTCFVSSVQRSSIECVCWKLCCCYCEYKKIQIVIVANSNNHHFNKELIEKTTEQHRENLNSNKVTIILRTKFDLRKKTKCEKQPSSNEKNEFLFFYLNDLEFDLIVEFDLFIFIDSFNLFLNFLFDEKYLLFFCDCLWILNSIELELVFFHSPSLCYYHLNIQIIFHSLSHFLTSFVMFIQIQIQNDKKRITNYEKAFFSFHFSN